MRYTYLLVVISVLLFVSCDKFRNSKFLHTTKIEFEDPHRRYNPIVDGSELNMSYKFTNTGDHPLVIKEVQTSCGCLVSKYSSAPIGKGKMGHVNLKFKSSKNFGFVKHYVTIIANIENSLTENISFEVNVVPNSHYIKDYEEVFFSDRELDEFAHLYTPILDIENPTK